jgi:hypothetical protein
MKFHPTCPYDAWFKAELDAIWPSLSADLSQVPTLPEHVGEQILVAILLRGCQAQNSRNIMLCREAAAEIPRDWLVPRIEKVAERALNLEDDWEYRRLFELCASFDDGLRHRLIARGLASDNVDVREAANDFLTCSSRFRT